MSNNDGDIENLVPLDSDIDLECLQPLHTNIADGDIENLVPLDSDIDLECLQPLHTNIADGDIENLVPLDSDIDLECLQPLHTNIADDRDPGGEPPPSPPSSLLQQLQPLPYLIIVVEPAHRSRFRYSSEMHIRSRGSILGVHSTPANKTYPTIEINHNGLEVDTAILVVSCVTKNEPYKVHPHKLFGPDTRDGLYVCECKLNETNELQLIGIGIHRARRSEISQVLENRAAVHTRLTEDGPNLQIDPFGYGFNHAADFSNGDLHAVRLAFQVFLQNSQGVWLPLAPVVSEPIFNENVPSDLLEIRWVSDLSSSFGGSETVVIELDQRIELNNTEVVFYENDDASNILRWWDTAQILRTHYACVTIKTPPCGRMSDDIVIAFFQVRMLTDNRCSEPRQFQYIPDRLARIPQDPVHGEQEPANRRRPQPMARFPAMCVPTCKSNLSSEIAQDSSDEEESFDSTEEESDNSSEDDSEHHNDSSGRDDSEDSSEDSIYEALAQLFIDSNDS